MPFGSVPNFAVGSILRSLASCGKGMAARAKLTQRATRRRGTNWRIRCMGAKKRKMRKGKTDA
jgi:hypothetical protein